MYLRACSDFDARQLGVGDQFFGFRLAQLGDEFRIIDEQQGRARLHILAASHGDLH